jgi:ABC-2 type transport system permease protein
MAFVFSLVLAIILFFGLLFLSNLITFWMPEQGWSAQFLVIVVITDFLSGGFFPLDIFPLTVQRILYALPFPYLLFFPLQVYLGKISGAMMWGGLLIAMAWVLVLMVALNFVWNRGIRKYEAVGR